MEAEDSVRQNERFRRLFHRFLRYPFKIPPSLKHIQLEPYRGVIRHCNRLAISMLRKKREPIHRDIILKIMQNNVVQSYIDSL